MERVLTDFVRVLRNAGVRVSPAETLDAADALALCGYDDRALLQQALAATLAKTIDDKQSFEECFARFFAGPDRTSVTTQLAPFDTALAMPVTGSAGAAIAAAGGAADPVPLQLAIDAAARDAGIAAMSSFTQRGLYVRKTLDALGWQELQQRILALEQMPAGVEPGAVAALALKQWSELLRERVREHVERHHLLFAGTQARELRESVLRTARLSQLEERDLVQITRIVRRIARRLAARHAVRRREYRRGQLDVPRTLRGGLAHDGLLFAPRWKSRRRNRPALITLCDVSGSVRAYARFLLLFLYGLGDVLPRVRSFVFSSQLVEVSELFAHNRAEHALAQVQHRYAGGSTDYGTALRGLLDASGRDLDAGATVVILGDARNNRGDPALPALREIGRRARRLIWLTPEPAPLWGTGDSEMLRYRSACSEVRVVQSIRQLERFADDLLRAG